MLSRDFSLQGYQQSQVEAELQLARGSNRTRTRFEVLDYNLSKLRDLKGIVGGSIINDKGARIIRTAKFNIREIPSGLADYRSLILSHNPVAYWELGTNDALFLSFVMVTAGDAFFYQNMSSLATYTIQTGDYLEYDVFLGASGNLIGFDYTCTDTTTLRGSSAVDQNGLGASPVVDLSAYANGMWYHRKIALPASHAGKVINKFDLACENNTGGTYTGMIRNIQITDGAGNQRRAIYIGGQAVPTLTTDRDSGGGQSLTATQRAIDATGNGNDGSYINSATGDAPGLLPGVADTALKCSGNTGGAVSAPNASLLNPSSAISLEAWASVTAIGSNQVVVMKQDSSPSQYWLRINTSGQFEFRLDISGVVILTSPSSVLAVANQAYHLIGTYDGATMKLYVNGLLVAQQAQTGALSSGTPGSVYFGANVPGAAGGLTGAIDETAIYAYALSAQQVRQHYDAGQGNQNEVNYESDRIKGYAGLYMPFQRYLRTVGEFDQSGNLESWSGANITGLAISGPNNVAGNLIGTLKGTSSSTSPSISRTNLSYSVSPFSNVEVRMRISASGSPNDSVVLQWQNPGDSGFSSAKQIAIPIVDDGGFRTLVFAGITGVTVSALQLLLGSQNSATIEIDYIRPTQPWTSQSPGTWIEWPLGVFLPSTSARVADSTGIIRQVDGFDLLQILVDDKVTSRYVVNSGTNYITAVTTLLTPAAPAVAIAYNAVADSRTLPGDKDWPTGTAKLDIVNQLLAAINYKPLYIDENGVAVITPYVQPVNRSPEYTFDGSKAGVSLIEANFQENVELFALPNYILASRQSAKSGTPILQAQQQNTNILSPTSFYRRGNRNVVSVVSQDAADGTSLSTFVSNALNAAANQQIVVKMTTPFFPDSHDDVYNVVHPPLGINVKCNESKWTLEFTQEGGPMLHEATQAVS